MSRLAKSGANVLISGMGGVGVETAKNIILAGVKEITIHDVSLASEDDLATQFYIDAADIGRNRASVTLPRLAELNPYVKVSAITTPFQDIVADLTSLKPFKCVILTDCCSLEHQLAINDYCHVNGIHFLVASSAGLFGWVFADFGDDFIVYDKNGEEIKETFVASITNGNPATVSCMEGHIHGLENDDHIRFREVEGMDELNGQTYKVTVINPNSFSIDCDTSSYQTYTRGGIVSDVKAPTSLSFVCCFERERERMTGDVLRLLTLIAYTSQKPLRQSIGSPAFLEFDLMKDPTMLHLGRQALGTFKEKNGSYPRPYNTDDWQQLVTIVNAVNEQYKFVTSIDEGIMRKLCFTSRGNICPISAILGGFTAQEALKSLTGKFTPLRQWLYIDALELYDKTEEERATSAAGNWAATLDGLNSKRLAAQIVALGHNACRTLEQSKLFMVGSGAIGCEMIKNYALLSVGCGNNGLITITDNDLIEKSNLNRQFLFRNKDINSPKSKTAANAARAMNERINIDAHQNKVEPNSENIYTIEFYQGLDLVVSALDNVEARVYVDSKCVANKRPLLESGTLGTKGHVQVILPNLTESYSSQKDPNEKQTPFCTLKSFPSNIDHCIQWSRDKFEKLFCINPAELDKFITEDDYIEKLLNSQTNNKIALCRSLSKLLEVFPHRFEDCITFARTKFEKLYNHNVLHLLRSYPLDLKTKEGVPFWTLPKRPPTTQQFSRDDDGHINFVKQAAYLWANIFGIQVPENADKLVYEFVNGVTLPPFKPKNKVIISDEKAQAPVETFSYEQFIELTKSLEQKLKTLKASEHWTKSMSLAPQDFEKDDDRNHHIDFITAASNMRARVYTITEVDRFKVKLIAGKIIPAIATTTSVVSGLVSLEMIKVLCKHAGLEPYKNCFLNLALPYFSLCEPGAAPKIKVTNTVSCTLWDKWEIENSNITVEEFIQFFNDKYGLKVSGIYQNSALVFMAALPFHRRRLSIPLKQLLEDLEGKKYIDLFVLFSDNGEDVKGPPVRFLLQ
ncbi:hypothetical protein SAMD00019534_066980 [Acytostelium subglobosum LB1]|uniref:hypothetical protein n=1 Tax=Acytostelium subglobosum LB1 TaxID=1410327 RepID=UPI000644E767|nr:hypothetical protein SAMD00019534_066980 [Acytostelium subglobosum LB1]GAM23523.1 hypothetical protein SAMD00019534_066980 [Acytostelium subglobosum LB1]|eukprot:XP_012753264.1 hypothetical protein SAMD00019534_066980 [Acytostelium subglobosum LB1]